MELKPIPQAASPQALSIASSYFFGIPFFTNPPIVHPIIIALALTIVPNILNLSL